METEQELKLLETLALTPEVANNVTEKELLQVTNILQISNISKKNQTQIYF